MRILRTQIPRTKIPQGLWLCLLAFALVACAPSADSAEPTTPPTAPPAATATATQLPGIAAFYASPTGGSQLRAEARQILQTYASDQQLIIEEFESLSADSLSPQTQIILILGPYEGLAELAAAAPNARIVALESGQQLEAPNLQLLSVSTRLDEQAAFIAGYAAALSTQDWRIGVIHTQQSAHLTQAFVAGMKFFCGSCLPVAPPYIIYPQIELAADAQNWQAAADLLLNQFILTVYLTPELNQPQIEAYFFNQGTLMIGARLTDSNYGSAWLASVGADSLSSLQLQLPLALAGLPPSTDTSPIALTQVNSQLLSEARLRHIDQIIDDLVNGLILLPSAD